MRQDQVSPELRKILLRVQKPGRYVGGEHNQTRKDWDSVETHVALLFPDIYDIGQPNLGLAILYDQLNTLPDVAAERVYLPWLDMEAEIKAANIPLFSLESKRPVKDFDVVGITLPYEAIYTNVLNALALAGIPLFSNERTEHDPLVIAGGHAAFNPEPMSSFFDAFVIGEGEEVMQEVLAVYQTWKRSGDARVKLLLDLAGLGGVYVPSLYDVQYHENGAIRSIKPLDERVPEIIKKRIVPILPDPITQFIVPNVEIVHERVSIEIMRGCTRGCRFCHAGMINRPVRERPVDEIITAMREGLKATGYEQVGLLSLSSSDHTRILEVANQCYTAFKEDRVQVNLPSLRIESLSVDLMDELKELKPAGGFTLAPEAATARMRGIINKPLDEEILLETARTIFEHGWQSLKLYFMIGLPQEEMEDVEAIIKLSEKILKIGKQTKGSRAKVHVSVGSFIPKAHTPFQWEPMEAVDSLQSKIDLLKAGLKKAGIKFSYNLPESTRLESWLSRGDRRLGQVIYHAWKNGAKFDAWTEQFNLEAWLDAFATAGLDPAFYAYRRRDLRELLPWEHISIGVTKQFLRADYLRSQKGETRDDCRNNCFYCGILDTFGDLQPDPEIAYWGCP